VTQTTLHHLHALQALVQVLAGEGIELEQYQYDGAAFGSFVLVLARGKENVRFTWDGKESMLSVERRSSKTNQGAGEWEHDAFIQAASSEDAFAEIGSNAEAMLL